MQVNPSEARASMHTPAKKELTPVKSKTKVEKLHEDLLKIISLKLWLINLLVEENVNEEQFNKMLIKYEDDFKYYLKEYNKLIAHARNIDPLEMSMNNSKVYLEELKMKKDIGIVSEGEYMAKEPKFRWEIDHYRDEILRRKKSLEALEDPTSVMPPEKINQMRRQMDHCLNEIDQLNTVYRISQETRDRVMDLLLEMHRYFNNFSVGGQRQSDGLTPDFEPPIKEEIFETRENASNEELEEAVKSEERRPILPEDTEQVPSSSEPDTEKGPQLTRVECPYDNKGKKCRVKAFGGSEFDAYKKLEAHVEKHHPEKVDEFNMTKLKKF